MDLRIIMQNIDYKSPESGEAIRIAYLNEKKLKIDTGNFNRILDKVGSRPMTIISINGPMRSGKSYIMNHFIRYISTYEETDGSPGNQWFYKNLNHEFYWNNSNKPQTIGINMWSKPFIVKRGDEEIAVLLMDTQGCFDKNATIRESAMIFSLSCILGSTLIYNVKNQLTEDVLQFLQTFIGYARMSDDPSQPQSLSKLIFLIRDWEFPEYNFGYYDDSTSAGDKNYKKENIDINSDIIPEVPSEIVRQEILSSFTDVGCCLMPHPGKYLTIYNDIVNVDSDFRNTIIDFIPRIFGENIITKKIGIKDITGEEFKGIVKTWAQYYDETTIPEPKSLFESTAEFQNEYAYSIALKHYKTEMEKHETGLSMDQYNKIHKEIEYDSIEKFESSGRVKNDDIKNKYFNLLIKAINELNQIYKQIIIIRDNFGKLIPEHKDESEHGSEDECMKIINENNINESQLIDSVINQLPNLELRSFSETIALIMSDETLIDSLEKFKLKSHEIIIELQIKSEEIRNHNLKCKVSKTVGTTLGTIGSAISVISFVVAPITLGASLVFGIPAMAVTAIGAVTNLVTQKINFTSSKEFVKKILSLADEYNTLAYDLQLRIMRYFGKDMTFDRDSIRIFNNVARAAVVAAEGAAQVATGVGKVIVKTVGVSVGLALTIVDVALTIRDWIKTNPTLADVITLIKHIEVGIRNANELLKLIDMIRKIPL